MEIDYGYHKCINCGRQDFIWGVKVDSETFICDLCIKETNEKIDDRKKDAQHKTWKSDKTIVMNIREILERRRKNELASKT